VTSGLRIGTPAMTSRGFGVEESKQITTWICDVLDNLDDESVEAEVKAKVVELCGRFPLYADVR